MHVYLCYLATRDIDRQWQHLILRKFGCCHRNILSVVRRRGELWPPQFSPQNKAGCWDALLIIKEMPVSPLDIPYHTKQSRAFQHCVSWENVSILIIVCPQRQKQPAWVKGNMGIFGPWTIWPISDRNRLIIELFCDKLQLLGINHRIKVPSCRDVWHPQIHFNGYAATNTSVITSCNPDSSLVCLGPLS